MSASRDSNTAGAARTRTTPLTSPRSSSSSLVSPRYVRRCLKKGNEIKLSLLPHPTHGVPVPEAPPLPPPPTPPPRPPSISIWELSPHAKLRVQVTGRHRHHYHSHHLHTHLHLTSSTLPPRPAPLGREPPRIGRPEAQGPCEARHQLAALGARRCVQWRRPARRVGQELRPGVRRGVHVQPSVERVAADRPPRLPPAACGARVLHAVCQARGRRQEGRRRGGARLGLDAGDGPPPPLPPPPPPPLPPLPPPPRRHHHLHLTSPPSRLDAAHRPQRPARHRRPLAAALARRRGQPDRLQHGERLGVRPRASGALRHVRRLRAAGGDAGRGRRDQGDAHDGAAAGTPRPPQPCATRRRPARHRV